MALNPFPIKDILADHGQGEMDDSLLEREVAFGEEESVDPQPEDHLSLVESASDEEALTTKKEYIVQAYQLSFDKEMAYLKCGVTEEEAKVLNEDKEFQDRLLYFLIQEREEILADLKDLAKSDKEEVRLKATLARGKMFYAARFDEDAKPDPAPTQKVDLTIHNTLELAIKKEDHAAQVLGILAENGVFQTGAGGLIDSKVESIHSAHSDSKTKRIPMA